MGENILIAGLGNPGKEYAQTRHNVGFMVTDILAKRWGVCFQPEARFLASVATVRRGEDKIFLCQPLTWMNNSGEAVSPLVRYYQVQPSRVLVVLDDADLPVGKLRLRPSGSPGGHHGMESVINRMGSDAIARLKVGIGDAGLRRITGHVLGKFTSSELPIINEVLECAADQTECWLRSGIQKAMNEFNGVFIDPKLEDN